ncbi:MAG: GxxExxY protein, partial [Methylococcaceae bacterium]|nr:GxxExxY protein [Methylococcaceae bacterium]
MNNERDTLSEALIGCAIEVHKALGPGLLESVYEQCLCVELASHSIPFRRQVAMPVTYKSEKIDGGFRLDLLVGERLVVEIKSVEKLLPIHQAQVLTYLRLGHFARGLLLNFNVPLLR